MLDIDALATVEDANWVYKGRSCLPSNPSRCLINLSDGLRELFRIGGFDKLMKIE